MNPAAYDLYLRGRGYLEFRNIDQAIAEFERAVEVDANYAPAHAAMGIAYTRGFQRENRGKNWLEKAQTQCEKALAITPQLAEGHTCLGNVYFSKGRYEDAVREFQKSLNLDHNSDETLGLLAEANEKLGNTKAAEESYRQAIALRPNYWGVYSAFGYFYFDQTRYAEAANMFRKAIQLAPQYYLGYSNLGAMSLLQGQYQDAVKALEKSITLRPTADAYGNLGAAYFYLRRYQESAQAFREALKIDGNDWQNWGNLGDALYQISAERTEALDAYRKATELASARLEVNPRDASILGYTADYYAMLDHEEQAKRSLAAALEISPRNGEILFHAAILYNHLGDSEKTVTFLRRAVEAGWSRSQIRDTPDFEHLKNDPRLQALLAGQ